MSHDLSSKAQDYWQAYSDSTQQDHHRRRSQLPWVANGKAWQILSSIWLLADQLFPCSISDHQTAPEKFSLTVSPSIRNHPQQGMNRKKDERGKCVRQAEWKASFKVGTSRKSTMNFRDSSTKPNFTGAVDSKCVEFAVSLEVGRWFTFIQLVVRRTPRNASQYIMIWHLYNKNRPARTAYRYVISISNDIIKHLLAKERDWTWMTIIEMYSRYIHHHHHPSVPIRISNVTVHLTESIGPESNASNWKRQKKSFEIRHLASKSIQPTWQWHRQITWRLVLYLRSPMVSGAVLQTRGRVIQCQPVGREKNT